MSYQEKDDEFEYHRELYVKCISEGRFPWESAYYYYMQNIDRIDVMSLQDFQEQLLTISNTFQNTTEAYDKVSAPIYHTLDEYYALSRLLSVDDKILKLL